MNTKHEAEDLLLSRVVDRRAGAKDFDQLEKLADEDPQLWARLAQWLKDDAQLRAAVDEAASVAEGIEFSAVLETRRPRRARRPSTRWIGWAAAALLAFLWIGANLIPGESDTAVARTTPDEALELYRQIGTEDGRLLSELPLLLVDSQPLAEEGRFELVYLRRLLERRIVDEMVQPAIDEHGEPIFDDLGQPMTIPANTAAYNSRSEEI